MGQIPTDINYGTCPGQKNAISSPASILETITMDLDANIEEALGVRATMEASSQQGDTFVILRKRWNFTPAITNAGTAPIPSGQYSIYAGSGLR
jgi:hypothetical protein